MEKNKYYFITNDGIHIDGYTTTRFEDEDGNLFDGNIEIENPSQDLLDNFIWYKLVDGDLVKMTEEEFKTVYPNYGIYVPSNEEIMMESIVDLQYQLDCMSLGLNVEGGVM